jgi:hypothetical protein
MNKEALKHFKGLSQDGGAGEIFCASPFNKDLLNETTFSQIHLDGQYLHAGVIYLDMFNYISAKIFVYVSNIFSHPHPAAV